MGPQSNYRRATVYVRRGNRLLQAETYVGTSEGRTRFEALALEARRVRKSYLGHLMKGAKIHKLSKAYVAEIKGRAGKLIKQ
jgi:hypothetical protein